MKAFLQDVEGFVVSDVRIYNDQMLILKFVCHITIEVLQMRRITLPHFSNFWDSATPTIIGIIDFMKQSSGVILVMAY